MRILLPALAALTFLAATAPGLAQGIDCSRDLTRCLSACRAAGLDRIECRRLQRSMLPEAPASGPVQRPGRSKYLPVPQDGGRAQQQGPYVNQQ